MSAARCPECRQVGGTDADKPYCRCCNPLGVRPWQPPFLRPRPAFSDDPRDSAIVSRPSGSGAGFSQGLPPVDDGDASMASLFNQRPGGAK